MKKRIIITYPNSLNAPGGGTRSCLAIARSLEKMGIEVILISVGSNSANKLHDSNISVISVDKQKLHYLLSGISVSRVAQKVIRAKKGSIDAVISWDYEGAFMPNVILGKNIPFCMIAAHPSYREWKARKTINWVKSLSDNWFRWRLCRKADVVFVSSDFTKAEMIDLFQVQPERIRKIYRGIDTIFASSRTPIDQPITNFIFYGSFAPNKGVYDVISALEKVAALGYEDWHLKLAGWGYEEELQAAILKHGINRKVTLLGKLSPKNLVEELHWAHVALLPSRAESFGRAIAEAQAASLAVISYDSGSIPEIVVDDVTGWIVPQGDTDSLAEAIVKAIQKPDKVAEMGRAGHRRVVDKFTWERTASLIIEGIQEAKQKINSEKG